jgi:hypothetical protein
MNNKLYIVKRNDFVIGSLYITTGPLLHLKMRNLSFFTYLEKHVAYIIIIYLQDSIILFSMLADPDASLSIYAVKMNSRHQIQCQWTSNCHEDECQ